MCTHTLGTLSEAGGVVSSVTSVFPSGEWDDRTATSGLLGGSNRKCTLWESWVLQHHGCDFGTEGQEFLRAPEAGAPRGQRPDGPRLPGLAQSPDKTSDLSGQSWWGSLSS